MTTSKENALAEVYFVLCNLNKDEYNKIPKKIIEEVKENRNIDYRFNMNRNLNIMQQTFLPETKAILFNLFKSYFATPEQKDKIYKIQSKEREELYKNQSYNPSDIFGKNNKSRVENAKEEVSLVEIKKENKVIGFFRKILKRIKTL